MNNFTVGQTATLSTAPPSVGGYDLGHMRIMLTRRPHWLARQLCHWLLDWRWVDV